MRFSTSLDSSPTGRILLVEDHRMGLAARKSVLEELGYKITTATNGTDALDHFANHNFDLIVTDYKMPRMNGIELIERVRISNDVIPVILLSGFAEALGLTEANTGANIVIQKNAHEVVHLTRAVARLLRKKAPRKPVASATTAAKSRRKAV